MHPTSACASVSGIGILVSTLLDAFPYLQLAAVTVSLIAGCLSIYKFFKD